MWKKTNDGGITWDSPWGVGRPGWHIECSVMATKHLGETIDIHGGGQDLAFPHHENEIAQSEAKTGKTFANYWMHNGFVTIGEIDEKMSKSLGNFVTVHELVQQHDPQILRFFLAATHYRRPLRFSQTSFKEAETNLARLRTTYENARFRLKDAAESLADDETFLAQWEQLIALFIQEMDDDFNAANGITVIYEMAKKINVYSQKERVSSVVLERVLAEFSELLTIFGIYFEQKELIDDEIEALIVERNQARLAKNFARSDEIRDLFKEQGIVLEDTPQGTRWRREK